MAGFLEGLPRRYLQVVALCFLGGLLGLTAMIGGQAVVNMSVVLSLVPTKGIPLPLVSNGGSSMLVNLIGMGVLLNVSQHASSSQVVTTTLPVPDA